MKQSVGHIVLAISMVFVLLFASTPADFIHEFAHHKDTIHKAEKGAVIEKMHHHCKFLSFELDHFIAHHAIRFCSMPVAEYWILATPLNPEHFIQRCIVATSLRGPPLAC